MFHVSAQWFKRQKVPTIWVLKEPQISSFPTPIYITYLTQVYQVLFSPTVLKCHRHTKRSPILKRIKKILAFIFFFVSGNPACTCTHNAWHAWCAMSNAIATGLRSFCSLCTNRETHLMLIIQSTPSTITSPIHGRLLKNL